MKRSYDVIVIGGGPAGLAAALAAFNEGGRTLIIERDFELGGILNQCIHSGFGLQYFKEELTGPEYARRFIKDVYKADIDVLTETMALSLSPDKRISILNTSGSQSLHASSIVLAMGCRERARGAVGICGERPSGVFTAGSAQRFINIEGYMIGRKAVILGSGDIGLIMARRLVLEGAEVAACVEIKPYSSGLRRNIVQCLDDFGIPLYLSHTVSRIHGLKRIEGVTVSRVDENCSIVPGKDIYFDCDTLLLSVGLIPENELTRMGGAKIDDRTNGPVVNSEMETSLPGVFACGNVLHVHDLVDYVSKEAEKAGRNAARYALLKKEKSSRTVDIAAGVGISYTVPQRIVLSNFSEGLEIFFRVKKVYENIKIRVECRATPVASFKREYCVPGEMEKIFLPEPLLKRIEGNELTIFIEEGVV